MEGRWKDGLYRAEIGSGYYAVREQKFIARPDGVENARKYELQVSSKSIWWLQRGSPLKADK